MKIIEQLDHRIIQAPIGSATSIELAAAVSNAGGMGSLAMSWTEAGTAHALVSKLKNMTDGLFAVNFVLSFKPKALAAVLDAGAPVITFSWGINAAHIDNAKRAGALVGVQVGSAAGVQQAIACNADFVICQGMEAGGHVQSTTSLSQLLSQVLAVAEHTPVFAAGGMADNLDVWRALDSGAAGAMLGTRFVAAHESNAHPAYQQAVVKAGDHSTAYTGCFNGEWPDASHRVLRNQTLDRWEAAGCPMSGHRPGEGELIATTAQGWEIPRYHMAAPVVTTSGDVLNLALYAGTGCTRITEVLPAKEIVQQLSEKPSPALSH